MPQGIECREGVRLCHADDRTVILNLTTDRYLLAPPKAHRALLCYREAGMTAAVRSGIQPLVEQGLLRFTRHPASIETNEFTPATRDLAPCRLDSRAALRFARAMTAHIAVYAATRILSFGACIRWLRDRKANSRFSAADPGEVASVMGGFIRARTFLPEHDRCLARSMAVFAACVDRHQEVNLIIGVRLHPFAAHCWVQQHDMVVNDMCDHVRHYRPILVV